MEKVFFIYKLLSTDIRTRANVEVLKSAIKDESGRFVFDFTNVTFISRSFTDELYNFSLEHSNVTFIHMNDFVNTMWCTVKDSRNQKRVFSTDSSDVKEFKDLDSLALFLDTI